MRWLRISGIVIGSLALTLGITAIKSWSQEQFVTALRTGRAPDGRALDGKFMPWRVIGTMTDAQMDALWGYLRTVPARPAGSR